MRKSEQRQREQIEENLIEHERIMGGDPRDVEAMLDAAEATPAHQRFPAAATLAVSLVRGDGGFERLTRIEQRLERTIHRNLDELRKLRKLNDEVASLRPSLRPCPFLAESAEEPVAEAEAKQEVEKSAAPATASVQNEAKADVASEENAAGASQIRAEYSPTPPSTAAPRAGRPCHEEAPRVENPCHEEAAPTGIPAQREVTPCHEEASRAGSLADETVNPFRYRYRAPPRSRASRRKTMARNY
jgi:hypothetical protein